MAASVSVGWRRHVVGHDQLDGQGGPVGRRLQRGLQAPVPQQRRVDPVGQLAELVEGVLHVAAQLVQHLVRRRPVGVDELLDQPHLHGQGDEVLLGPVVQVALDLAPGLVGRGDDAQAGGRQLLVAFLELLERGLQGRVEADVVQGEADLTGELGEDPVVVVGERRVVGPALHHDQPEQLTEVGHHGGPDLGPVATLQQARHPDLQPGVALDVGPRGHAELLALQVRGGRRPGPGPRPPGPGSRLTPVQTSDAVRVRLFFSDSASWSRSSSIGTARDMRPAKVRTASSGRWRSP